MYSPDRKILNDSLIKLKELQSFLEKLPYVPPNFDIICTELGLLIKEIEAHIKRLSILR